MLTIKKKAIALSVMAGITLLSSPVFAEGTITPPSDVSMVKLRIPINNLVKANQLPSEFTLWREFVERRDYTEWTPATAAIHAQYNGNIGVVIRGGIRDVFVPDFAQTRSYEVDEFRMEQKKIEDGRGDIVNDGEPIRHERTLRRDENRVVSVSNAEWRDLSDVSCTDWTSVGESSRYLTPYTQDAEGQERVCTVEQLRQVTINDPDGAVPFSQQRTLQYTESSTQKGLMANQSCRSLLVYYNANAAKIKAASSSWSPSGWKRLDLNPGTNFVTYCNGGWTMVAAQFEGSPVAWTGANFDSNLKDSYDSRKGFSIPNSGLPSHSKFGVGDGGTLTVRLDSGKYHTGDLSMSLRGNGKTYNISRKSGSHHMWHNPKAPVSTAAPWNNTLTFDTSTAATGSNNIWAFSPNERAACSRGWALNGYRANASDSKAWTVWVY
ncbi:hypothetical protein LMH73_007335 [Vibrio splendidus]|nr:hypothetical protein [Vibrio splendidus]MCC4883134.1 hypothetical protein [Vibrio splendidus]